MIADTPDKEMEMNTENAPQVEMVSELPELPRSMIQVYVATDYGTQWRDALDDYYTADQMRAYAQAALNARAGGDGLRELLESVFEDGFLISCEGWNGEYGGNTDGATFKRERDAAIDAALASQAVGVKDGR